MIESVKQLYSMLLRITGSGKTTTIVLADNSLAGNTASGVPKEQIDLGRLEAVEESLPR